MSDFLLVIPARYKSSRLPGKPLLKIKGVPMIIRTYNQCKKAVSESKILVATDHKKIFDLCKKNKINALMTSNKCLTGTDRIAEVAKKYKAKFYLNVQGDEPICNTSDIKKLLRYAKKYPNKIINGYTKITNKKDFYSPHIPKVVTRKDGNLIYMSRAPIPYNKVNLFKKDGDRFAYILFRLNRLKYFQKTRKKHH